MAVALSWFALRWPREDTPEQILDAIRLLATTAGVPTGTSINSSFTGSNPYDFRAEYASSDFDIRHNLLAAFTYALPGKSAHFQNVAARLLGGWSLEGIFTAQTGVPFTPLIGEDIAGNGDQFPVCARCPNGRRAFPSS